jgi:hypothetical protein
VSSPEPPDPADAVAARRRTVLFTAVGGLLAAALLVAIVARVQSTNVDTGGGAGGTRTAEFDVGNAEQRAASVARDGPVLFPDPQGKSRDIFVQHLGGTDWVAFEARAGGSPRQCVLRWEHAARQFVDPCDGRVYPPDGTGLVTFPTRVNDKGRVIVDLGKPSPPLAP